MTATIAPVYAALNAGLRDLRYRRRRLSLSSPVRDFGWPGASLGPGPGLESAAGHRGAADSVAVAVSGTNAAAKASGEVRTCSNPATARYTATYKPSSIASKGSLVLVRRDPLRYFEYLVATTISFSFP